MLAQLKKCYCLMFLVLTPLAAASRRESKKRPLTLEPVPEAAGSSVHRSLPAARNPRGLTVAIPGDPYPRTLQGARTIQTERRSVKYKPLEMEAVDVVMPTMTDTSAPRASMSAEPLSSLMMAIADEDINAVRAALARGERLSPEEITMINPTEAILALLAFCYKK